MQLGDLVLLQGRAFTHHLHNCIMAPRILDYDDRVPHHTGVVTINLFELAPLHADHKVENRVQLLLDFLYYL
jgi:hypothetical protein